jgi:hypothetical protein
MTKRRLLILSCSKRKHPTLRPLPAIERYNGPVFLVLRRFLRERPDEAKLLDVYILSAAHGLISAICPIAPYDQKMNRARAVELKPQVLADFGGLMQNDYAALCLVMGKTYFAALEGWQDLVPANLLATVAKGPMGMKQAQLKKWLWENVQITEKVDD